MSSEYVLSVLLQAQNKAAGTIANFVSSLNPIAGGALAVGAAVVGIGAASVKMAADYQQSMNKVQALTGSNNQQMAQYDDGVKKLATDAGVAPKKLADGLYNVLSAGYQGKDAMKMLTLATEDAKIGMTDSATTTKALTNVMANFNVKVSDATRVNGEMLQTVTLGKASFSDYANNITKAASTSAQFHEKMETMNAAWATLTANGISAGMATTDYDQSLQVMDGNIGTVTKSLHKNGIAFDETKFNTMDYGHKVVYLNQALEDAHSKHIKITGATVQASQAIKTISDHIKMYNDDLGSLSNKQAMAQKTQQAWQITQSGFNQTMDRLHATLDVVMISIGQKLLPVITKLAVQLIPIIQHIGDWLIKSGALNTIANTLSATIHGVVDAVSTLVSWGFRLASFFHDNQFAMDVLKSIVVGTGVAITLFAMTQIPAMITSLVAWAIAQWAVATAVLATAGPFILIGLLVAAVVLGIILAIQHWGDIMDWISGKTEQTRIKVEVTQEKQKVAAIKKTEEQKQGVLKQLEDERQQVIKKIHDMADGADKEREKMHLRDLDRQIKATKDHIKELEKEKQQHLAKLKQLAADDLEARKNWYDRANDSVTAWFNSWNGALSRTIGGWMSALGTWVHNSLDWLNTVIQGWSKGLQKWGDDNLTNLKNMVGGWFSALGTWVHDALSHVGQMKDGFIAKLGQLKDGAIAKVQALINGVKSFFINLPREALQWGANLLQSFTDGITSKISGLLGTVSGAIQGVKNLIGFHSPAKTGPGADADTWAVNLMKMYIHGIQGGLPGIKVAVNKAAELMKAGFTGDANALNQKINVAQYQLYLDKRAAVDAKYRAREAKHYETWLAAQHKRYEKYLAARQKALDKYNSEKHHKKAFHYHDFKVDKFKALKETLPKFTGLALGAFANQTNILDPSMGNGAPMALPASQTSSNRPILVDSSVHLTVHGSVVDHTKLLNDLQKQQDKNHRMSGLHVPVTSGGRAR